MDPATLALILQLVEQAVAVTPGLVADLQKLFSSGTPTAADFAALRAAVASETYGQLVPNSQLPPSETGESAPAASGS